MKKIQITLAIGLVFFYSALGYLSLNPNVSAEYREYYIDKTSIVSPTQIKRLQPVEIGIPYTHNDEVHLAFKSGWSHAEKEYRWNAGRIASILFIATEREKSNVKTLHLRFHMQTRQSVEISLNGTPIFENPPIESIDAIDIGLGTDILKVGINSIEFRFPDTTKPGGSNNQLRSVALKELRFD